MQNTTTINTDLPFHKTGRPRGLKRLAAVAAIALAAIALAAIPAAQAQPGFFLTELPTPAGYEFSVPYQINDGVFRPVVLKPALKRQS
jgi:hypothetical protein